MDIIINQIALWRACGTKQLNKRISPPGQTIRRAGSGVFLRSDKPIMRYCKDYTVGSGKSKMEFCLFVRTEIDNDSIVEQQLDSAAAEVTKEDVLRATTNCDASTFEYLPKLIRLEEA